MFEPIVIWDLEDDPEGNYIHIVIEHEVSIEEVEEVLQNPRNSTDRSHSSGRTITFGWTSTGRHILVVYEHVADDPKMVRPVTAYETPPQSRRTR
jgi:uncharacterized DUF497 family protein